jgi:replicative DNA helicase
MGLSSDITLPHDRDIERLVLGSCLCMPSAMADVADMLSPDMFSDPAHAEIWRTLADMHRRRAPIDTVTVVTDLRRRSRLDMVGGAAYVSELTLLVASDRHTHYHAALLVQIHVKREAVLLGHRLQNLGSDSGTDPFDLLAGAASDIRLLNEMGTTEARNMAEVVGDVVDDTAPDRGIRLGFEAIEDKQLRLEPGTVTIIGARPAMGKTAFMLSCAWRQAQRGHRPYIAELEMKDRNLGRRLVCGEAGVPVWKSKRKVLAAVEVERMANWHIQHGDTLSRMIIDEASSMTVSTLAAKLDRAKRKHQIDVVWVDYIGLLQPSTKRQPGYERMTAISNELRVLAKDMDLPFAVLAQLSRPPKGTSVKPPALPDLRDSGEIEQDAEAVLFLHRPKYYDMGADDNVDVIIAKNRDGSDGIATLFFDGPGTRMLDWPSGTPTFDARLPIATPPNDEPAPF